MLQVCYECVKSLLLVCYKCDMSLLQVCYKCATTVLLVCYKWVTSKLLVYYKFVTTQLCVLRVYYKCIMSVMSATICKRQEVYFLLYANLSVSFLDFSIFPSPGGVIPGAAAATVAGRPREQPSGPHSQP